IHSRALTKKVDRQDRPGPGSDGLLESRRVYVECARFDVREHWRSSKPRDATSRCKEREWSGDHLVPRTDIERHHSQQQGIGAGGATDSVVRAAVSCYCFLELSDLRSENEMLAAQNCRHGMSDLLSNGIMLNLQVQQRHIHLAYLAHFLRWWLPERRMGRFDTQ